MKKILLVLAMIAASVFLAQPAVAAEGDPPAETATTETVTAAPAEAAPEPAPAPAPEPAPAPAPPAPETGTPPPSDGGDPPPVVNEENPPPAEDVNKAEEPADEPEAAAPADEEVVAAAPVKIKICHSTSSQTNPYVENSPNASGDLHGHTGHTGGIFPADGWGDIIPPFVFGDVNFPGMNWTDAGQAIYNNGCNLPNEVPIPLIDATAVPPSAIPPSCNTPGMLVLPQTTGVIYESTPAGTGPGDYTVTASAVVGYVLTNPLYEETITVLPQLSADNPQCVITDDDHVTICHRTNSNTNPYVVISPDAAGVYNGHDKKHNGPVWNPTLKAQHIKWGDIIPPYSFDGTDYPGQNWTPEGQAIYRAGCGAGVPPIEVTPAVDLTSNCDDGDVPSTVAVDGVVYTFTEGDGEEGTWEITASLVDDDYVFADDAQTVFTGDAGDPDSCIKPEDEDALLPDTGGLPLWILLIAGPMTAAGLIILMRREPVSRTSTGGGMPSYSLILPPAPKPLGIKRAHATTEHIGFMKAVGNVVAAIGAFFRGGRR